MNLNLRKTAQSDEELYEFMLKHLIDEDDPVKDVFYWWVSFTHIYGVRDKLAEHIRLGAAARFEGMQEYLDADGLQSFIDDYHEMFGEHLEGPYYPEISEEDVEP